MFIVFIMILCASLATVSAQLFNALTLQAKTVEYTIKTVKLEEYLQGVLAYARVDCAHADPTEKLGTARIVNCDIFKTADDGFIEAVITFVRAADGYDIRIVMSMSGQVCGDMSVHVRVY